MSILIRESMSSAAPIAVRTCTVDRLAARCTPVSIVSDQCEECEHRSVTWQFEMKITECIESRAINWLEQGNREDTRLTPTRTRVHSETAKLDDGRIRTHEQKSICVPHRPHLLLMCPYVDWYEHANTVKNRFDEIFRRTIQRLDTSAEQVRFHTRIDCTQAHPGDDTTQHDTTSTLAMCSQCVRIMCAQ
jgi:hypothetical protein